MSLTLEPDYFISSNGLPKLNSKKYKTYDRKSYRSKVENREQVSCEKTVLGEQEKRLFSGSGIGMDTKPYCDSKKLLSRRSNMETTRIPFNSKNIDYYHRCGGKQSTNKMSDKDLKCAINQKIKLCRNNLKSLQHREEISSNNSSNGMLDNRLMITTTTAGTPYQQKYFNEIISDHETDTLVLDF